ncbi:MULTISPECIES: histidine phosphatase family protein [unclassified Pseudomonas]|uniref:lipopolysaccharide core heptose(II)-phosphate phosphatase PmrG n=1 Tax=unclassified Pseudomonas TaxID=196821 RepID=UPI0025D5E7F3|nr:MULTISPECIES: histidine phosphatase family protein [unclassified Pseudomonas]
MNPHLHAALDGLTGRYRVSAKFYRVLLLVVAMIVIASTAAFALRPVALTDLSEGHHLRKANFYPLWEKGELVVLMRHAERCDHSTNPCLSQPDGITARGRHVAQKLGRTFQALGLDQATIYNSPLRRTEQTSTYAFNHTTEGQEWLDNCSKSMLDDVLKHKLDGHNLILVTHSECISDLEKSLHVPTPMSLDYAASLILSVDPHDHTAKVLGFIDARDWRTVVAQRPTPQGPR